MTNLVNSSGVVATDTTGVGTARSRLAACSYGEDKGIFAFGRTPGVNYDESNLVTNVGVVGSDVTGVGAVRYDVAAAKYGTDKAIFGWGNSSGGTLNNITNS